MGEERIGLGAIVQDKVSRFKGTLVGRSEHIDGYRSGLIQPEVDRDGKFREAQWFAENRIVPATAPATAKQRSSNFD